MAGVEGLSFAALLKRHRRLTGLTQEELAERAGYSPAYISALERGVRTPLLTTTQLLADSLDLEPEDRAQLLEAGSKMTPRPPEGNVAQPLSMPGPKGPGLVGRARELERIERHLLRQGTAVLLVTGEPGIGKTRLLQETKTRAAERGYTVLQAGCQRHSARQAYAPLIDAVTVYLEQLPAAEHPRILQGCHALVHLMPELTEAGHLPPPAALPPEQERRLAFRAIGRLLRNAAGPAGTLLLLDDLHWAGQDALDLLGSLVHEAPASPLSVVTAYRDTELAPGSPLSVLMADLASARLADHLVLGPLTHAESLELLGTVLESRGGIEAAGDADSLEPIARRAEGVPFFLVSSAESLESGIPLDDVPWDMAQGIRQRIAGLSPAARQVLEIAAIAGDVASQQLLIAVSGLPEADVIDALETAVAARVLDQEVESGYHFSHEVVREVVESDVGASRRAVLHRHIAEALEDEGGDVELLALHYARSGQRDRAVTYLERAGDKARSEHAFAAAVDFYRESLALKGHADRDVESASVREKLGEALLVSGRYDEAVQVLAQAAEMYGVAGERDGEARAVAQLGHAHFRRGTAAEGIQRLETLLASLEEQGSEETAPRCALDLHSALIYLYYSLGRFQESLASTIRVTEMARRSNESVMLAEAEVARGVVLCALSSPAEGARVLEAALPLAERVGALRMRENGLQVLAGVYLIQGELEKGRVLLEQAMSLAKEQEDRATLVIHLALLGRYYFVGGDWGQAHAYLERAVDIARSIGPAWYTVMPLTQLGVLLQAEGDWEAASRCFEEVLSAAESGRVARGMPLAMIASAQMDILRGHPEQAAKRLAPLVERAHEDWAYGTQALTTAAWAHLELEDGQAEALVQQALAMADKTSNRVDLIGALRVQAMVHHGQGAGQEAERIFGEAASLAASIPYPYAQARALYEWGKMHAAEGEPEEARRRLNEALPIFRRLGAMKDVEQTQQALDRLTCS